MSAAALQLLEESDELHFSVMRSEIVQLFAARPAKVLLDVTAGAGGHSEALLEALPQARLIAFDRDQAAVERCRERLSRFGGRASVVHLDFASIGPWLVQQQLGRVDGLVADLGLSSPQLDVAERGMSFRQEGPIDMRMDRSQGETAAELIARLEEEDLADVIYHYGGERRSRRVARCIKQALAADELKGTLSLRKAVVRALGPQRVGGVDPATRTFQALRIAVNRELEQLDALLECLPAVVRPGGLVAILSFHSLEDRRVKQCFLQEQRYRRLWKRPLTASAPELEANPRSRSAKLRAAELQPLELAPGPSGPASLQEAQ